MNGYEFDCVNYSDESDTAMYWGWDCLRRMFQSSRDEPWRFARDEGRIRLAHKAYAAVKCLARTQAGKVSLLIDPELGLCYVSAENMTCLQCSGLPEKLHAFRLLSSADDFTVTRGAEAGLTLKLGFKAFRKIKDES